MVMPTIAKFNDNGARPLPNAFVNTNPVLDVCLLVAYCFLIFGIMPVLVVTSWGLEALSLSFFSPKN